MGLIKILFDSNGHAKSHIEISKKINAFGDSYNNAAKEIINNSKILDKDGEVFINCATRILSNFGMTRRGPFFGNYKDKLQLEIIINLCTCHRWYGNSRIYRLHGQCFSLRLW